MYSSLIFGPKNRKSILNKNSFIYDPEYLKTLLEIRLTQPIVKEVADARISGINFYTMRFKFINETLSHEDVDLLIKHVYAPLGPLIDAWYSALNFVVFDFKKIDLNQYIPKNKRTQKRNEEWVPYIPNITSIIVGGYEEQGIVHLHAYYRDMEFQNRELVIFQQTNGLVGTVLDPSEIVSEMASIYEDVRRVNIADIQLMQRMNDFTNPVLYLKPEYNKDVANIQIQGRAMLTDPGTKLNIWGLQGTESDFQMESSTNQEQTYFHNVKGYIVDPRTNLGMIPSGYDIANNQPKPYSIESLQNPFIGVLKDHVTSILRVPSSYFTGLMARSKKEASTSVSEEHRFILTEVRASIMRENKVVIEALIRRLYDVEVEVIYKQNIPLTIREFLLLLQNKVLTTYMVRDFLLPLIGVTDPQTYNDFPDGQVRWGVPEFIQLYQSALFGESERLKLKELFWHDAGFDIEDFKMPQMTTPEPPTLKQQMLGVDTKGGGGGKKKKKKSGGSSSSSGSGLKMKRTKMLTDDDQEASRQEKRKEDTQFNKNG